jgi:hypothetical protein
MLLPLMRSQQGARRQLRMGRELAQRSHRVARLLRHPVELGMAAAVGREQIAHCLAAQDRINQPQACFRLVRLCRHRRVLLFP